MLQTARALAEKGLAVFPCLPRDKRPATPRGLKDATTDPLAIEAWWQQEPSYNVAVVTGSISGIFVVDIDGEDAEDELRRLEALHGELPATVESITARGRHVFFRWPDKAIRNSTSKIAPGIDVRGIGGYVLVPPSIHPTGRRYCWSVDSASAFAAAPDWLLAIIAEPTAAVPPTPPAEWRELVRAGVGEGQRNQTITRLAGYLLRHHVDPLVALELLKAWNASCCQPPLEAAELDTIVDSIARRELKRRGAG
jgi:hypothetical protein